MTLRRAVAASGLAVGLLAALDAGVANAAKDQAPAFVPTNPGAPTLSFKEVLRPTSREAFRRTVCQHWGSPDGPSRCPPFAEMQVKRLGGPTCHGLISGILVEWSDPTPRSVVSGNDRIVPGFTTWGAMLSSDQFNAYIQPRYRSAFGTTKGCPPPI